MLPLSHRSGAPLHQRSNLSRIDRADRPPRGGLGAGHRDTKLDRDPTVFRNHGFRLRRTMVPLFNWRRLKLPENLIMEAIGDFQVCLSDGTRPPR